MIRDPTVLVNTTYTATIRLHEEGNYTCVATSKYGTDVGEVSVIFTGEESILFDDLQIKRKDILQVHCSDHKRKSAIGHKLPIYHHPVLSEKTINSSLILVPVVPDSNATSSRRLRVKYCYFLWNHRMRFEQ